MSVTFALTLFAFAFCVLAIYCARMVIGMTCTRDARDECSSVTAETARVCRVGMSFRNVRNGRKSGPASRPAAIPSLASVHEVRYRLQQTFAAGAGVLAVRWELLPLSKLGIKLQKECTSLGYLLVARSSANR